MNDELQVIDIQVGDGKAAVKGALITTQYRGWLEDGTEFDSSYSRGKPFQCVIGTGRVIKGLGSGDYGHAGWWQAQVAGAGASGLWRAYDGGDHAEFEFDFRD